MSIDTVPLSPILKQLLSSVILAASMATGVTSTFADASYMTKTVSLPHRNVPVKLDIYYPVENGGKRIMHGENIVFKGIELTAGAPPRAGIHPVVFFSHGSGGNGVNTGWILKAFAEAGMIAIAPNHPGSTSQDSDPAQSLKTWERPNDISALIEQLPEILPQELEGDIEKVAAVGFSLGGYSVLSLAGAQISKSDFINHCEENFGKGLNECDWFTKDGFDLDDIDRAGFEANNKDQRVKAVISIDPGFAAAFKPQSLSLIETPVQIFNLGSQGTVYSGINAEDLVKHIQGAEYVRIEKSWHFSFLGECKWTGPYFLAITFDDPICDDVDDRRRIDVHQQIAEHAVHFLIRRFAAMK